MKWSILISAPIVPAGGPLCRVERRGRTSNPARLFLEDPRLAHGRVAEFDDRRARLPVACTGKEP